MIFFRDRSFISMLILITFLSTGCGNREEYQGLDGRGVSGMPESLVQANKHIVNTEDEQIRNLIARYGWDMSETGTGLRYLIYHHGNGKQARRGDMATINYEIRLITGDIVYSSTDSGSKVFRIGSGGVESGLEEAILLLREGDKAKLILPSHLAWGLIGDQDRIPPKSTLIYDVEIVNLNSNKSIH